MIAHPLWSWTDDASAVPPAASSVGSNKPFGYFYGWAFFILDILTRG